MVRQEDGRVALVTGAGRGIGRCIAERLLAQGYEVLLADLDGEGAKRAAAGTGAPRRAVPWQVDVGDEPSVREMMAQVARRFGRLDLLVNNAALAKAHAAPVQDLTLEEWNRVIATNLTGVFLCVKHAAPLLRGSRGAIVNIASTRALQSEANTEAYSAGKGGVVALTHALAMSLGPEVRVNCISPGWIHTGDDSELADADHRQHPVGRVGRPEDVAELALYLASPASGFVTGQNLVVDGGMTRKMIYAE